MFLAKSLPLCKSNFPVYAPALWEVFLHVSIGFFCVATSHKEMANQFLLPSISSPAKHIENHKDTRGSKNRQNEDKSLYGTMSTQEIKPDTYTLADGTLSVVKTCIMGHMPERIIEGDLVAIGGLFCGPPVERISILLTPIYNDRGVINIRSKLTKKIRSGQKFVAEVQPPRGTFHVTVLLILVGEDHPVTEKIHQIEVISACISRIKQVCSCISPQVDTTMATPIKERLSYKTFNDISYQTFRDLKNIYEDILLFEKCCTEVVQNVSSESNHQIWQDMVELADEIYRLYERCFLALRPFDQGHLLHFLPGRMWNIIQLVCKCLCIHRRVILQTFLDKAKSILEHLLEIAPEFTESWNDMILLLQDARTYIGLVDIMN